jgi:hypothetical protein
VSRDKIVNSSAPVRLFWFARESWRSLGCDQPKVAADEVYDTRDEAESFAAEMRAAMATIGRRERFTVHELVEEGTTDGG